jgi:hypothetical protein
LPMRAETSSDFTNRFATREAPPAAGRPPSCLRCRRGVHGAASTSGW